MWSTERFLGSGQAKERREEVGGKKMWQREEPELDGLKDFITPD